MEICAPKNKQLSIFLVPPPEITPDAVASSTYPVLDWPLVHVLLVNWKLTAPSATPRYGSCPEESTVQWSMMNGGLDRFDEPTYLA